MYDIILYTEYDSTVHEAADEGHRVYSTYCTCTVYRRILYAEYAVYKIMYTEDVLYCVQRQYEAV